jgi:hypothetical protein
MYTFPLQTFSWFIHTTGIATSGQGSSGKGGLIDGWPRGTERGLRQGETVPGSEELRETRTGKNAFGAGFHKKSYTLNSLPQTLAVSPSLCHCVDSDRSSAGYVAEGNFLRETL